MLRKLYFVSQDYLHENEQRSSQPTAMQQTSPLQKTRASVKRKKKGEGSKHPCDKWVPMREEIAEAAVGRRALIKAIADFIKVVLPDTTLAQKAVTP